MNGNLLKLTCIVLVLLILKGFLANALMQASAGDGLQQVIQPLSIDNLDSFGYSIVKGCEDLWAKHYSGKEQNGYVVMQGFDLATLEILELSDYGKTLLTGVNQLVRVTRSGTKEGIHIPEDIFRILGTASCLTATREQMQDGFQSYKDGVYFGIPASICITESAWDPMSLSEVGAQGVCQLMPGTYKRVTPFVSSSAWNIVDNILSAANKMGPIDNRLNVYGGGSNWVNSFTGQSGWNSWNNHEPQARETYNGAVMIYNYEISFLQNLVSGGNNVNLTGK